MRTQEWGRRREDGTVYDLGHDCMGRRCGSEGYRASYLELDGGEKPLLLHPGC